MAEVVTNGERTLDIGETRKALLTNSTKRRTSELQSLQHRLEGLSPNELSLILNLLFETYPLYVDGPSRREVERCLSSIASGDAAEKTLSAFVDEIQTESAKPAIAPGNAFVLVRWASLLLQRTAQEKSLWNGLGKKTILALTNAVNTLLGSESKQSTVATALRVSRRAIRTLAKTDDGPAILDECITLLSAKGPSPAPKNAITLGIIAGVCKRIPGREQVVDDRRQDYFAFFIRELLGSRVQLPNYIGTALRDFFAEYVNMEDLEKEIIPAVEKSLLRAPEVVLNDLIAPLINSLPRDIDLSDIFFSRLLKPLLSNTKSSNATVREGAARTFGVAASRCADEQALSKIADEILNPLKGGKVASADQRVLHAQMLASLQSSGSLSAKISQGLAPVASKETNEAAAAADMHALSKCVRVCLEGKIKLDTAVVDVLTKGLAEKRLPIRRLWAMSFAEAVWSLSDDALQADATAALVDSSIGKLMDVFNEVASNPVPAVQTGQVPGACIAIAICMSKTSKMSTLKSASVIKKAAVGERALTMEPKPSLLLNPRVYTKLTAEDDLRWHMRATVAALHSYRPTLGRVYQWLGRKH